MGTINLLIANELIAQGFDKCKSITLASFVSAFIFYPFDLVSTRLCADMSIYESKRIYNSVSDAMRKSLIYERGSKNKNSDIKRLYRGLLPSYITLISINFLSSIFYLDWNSDKQLIMQASIIPFILSFSIYPVDTYKRHIQLNTAVRNSNNKLDYRVKDYFNTGVRVWYRGFSLQLMKSLIFGVASYFSYGLVNNYSKVSI